MDSKRFDNWTRNRVRRLSRRDALRLAGAGGVATTLSARSLGARAQSTCTLTLHGETSGGPSAPATYDGILQFTVGSDGTLTQAFFTPNVGSAAAASGALTGRAFDLSIAIAPGQILALSGASDQQGPACPTAATGILAGPQPGDLGAWQATAGSGTATSSSNQPSSAQPSSAQPPSGPSAPTSCAQGQTLCAGTCVPNCSNGQSLEPNTCTCASQCLPDGSPCQLNVECCGGFCDFTTGTCTVCAGLMCGQMGCVDPATDPNNCGACGNVCVDDTGFCLGGVCQCIPDNEPKGSSSSSCCSKGYVEPTGLCGCAQLGEWCGSTGECCDNATLGAICVDSGTGFKGCCFSSGSACASDADCCFSALGFSPQTACINGLCGPKP